MQLLDPQKKLNIYGGRFYDLRDIYWENFSSEGKIE